MKCLSHKTGDYVKIVVVTFSVILFYSFWVKTTKNIFGKDEIMPPFKIERLEI